MHVLALAAVVVVTPLAGLAAAQSAGSVQVQTEVVGSFPGSQWTVPTAINNKGEVVGWITSNTVSRFTAITWTRDAGFRVLLEDAVATDINNRGDVSGYRFECTSFPGGGQSCASRGFLWNTKTGFLELGDFVPNALNDSGDMAGDCVGGSTIVACAMHNGVLTQWICDLPDCGTTAYGINARGDVAGWRNSPDVQDAVLFTRDGGQVVLGLGTAEDINNAGVIAGRTDEGATIWRHDRMLTAPGTSVAIAVNGRGWTAGVRFGSGSGINDAFFWDPATGRVLYLDPAGTGSEALDINDRGEIVGTTNQLRQAVIWRVRN